METIAFQDIWHAKWIDRLGWGSFCTSLIPLFIWLAVLAAFSPIVTFEIFEVIASSFGLWCLFYLWLHLARSTQIDLEGITTIVQSTGASTSELVGSHRRVEIFVALTSGVAYFIGLSPFIGSYERTIFVLSPNWDIKDMLGLGYYMVFFLLVIHWGSLIGRIHRLYATIVKDMRVSLLQVHQYPIFAKPMLNFLAMMVVLISLEGIAYQQGHFSNVMILLIGFQMLATVVGIAKFGLPIFVIRNRVRSAKMAELERIRLALVGDRSALSESEIKQIAEDVSMIELMHYESRIQAVWEWPFQAHLQRLVLFGLIPPTTWVMAAIVEGMVDSLMP